MSKAKAAGPGVEVTYVECDLASLASVGGVLERFKSSRLDILICNAGIMVTPPALTADGYELQFGTNHLGHALLIKRLLPTMLRTAEEPNADVRIVLLTSIGFHFHPRAGIVFDGLRTTQDFGAFGPWIRYGQSKLANILYAAELARRYPAITTTSIHPGVVETGLVGRLGWANKLFVYATTLGRLTRPEEGAYNQLWAAAGDRSQIINGAFYEPVGRLSKSHDKASKSEELAAELWDWTEKQLAQY